MIEAVIFDLDGVLIDSEHVWDEVREQLVSERGGHWHERAQGDMMGMSSNEWSRYMHDVIGLPESPEEINGEVVRRMEEQYAEHLPLIAGAVTAVRRLASSFRLGLASSSNRSIIDTVLSRADLADLFEVTVSSEEVAAGKPAPDVFLEAALRLGVALERCAAIEDPLPAPDQSPGDPRRQRADEEGAPARLGGRSLLPGPHRLLERDDG